MGEGIAKAEFKSIEKMTLSTRSGDHPLAGVDINWGIDRDTMCGVKLIMGEKILPMKSGSFEGLFKVKPDEELKVTMTVDGNKETLHVGYLLSDRLSSVDSVKATANILSRGLSLKGNLSLLAAVSPATRVFFDGKGSDSPSGVSSKVLISPEDGSSPSVFKWNADDSDGINLAFYIRKLLSDLMSKYKNVVDINKILKTKKTYVLNGDVALGDHGQVTSAITMKYAAQSAHLWERSTAYQALMAFNKLAFLHVFPKDIDKGTFELAPSLAMGADIVGDIPLSDILTVVDREGFDNERMIHVNQVWVNKTKMSGDDAGNKAPSSSRDKSDYYVWPLNVPHGNALIKPPPLLFDPSYDYSLVKGGPFNKKKKVSIKGVKKDKKSEKLPVNGGKNKYDVDDNDRKTLGTACAKMYYAEHVFENRRVSLSIPWWRYRKMVGLIGGLITFDPPFAKNGDSTYVGYLTNVALSVKRDAMSATCVVDLWFVRTLKDNHDVSLPENPFYKDWRLKK